MSVVCYTYADGEVERAEGDDLLCVSCGMPVVDPRVHGPCRIMACRTCFAKCEKCPHCMGGLNAGELADLLPLSVTRKLAALGVRCPACDIVVTRGTLDAHVQECPLECERGCGIKVTPAQRVQHDGICGALESPCTAYGCAVVLPRSNLAAHRAQCALVAIEPATRSLLVHLETSRLRCAEEQKRCLAEGFAEHTQRFTARLEEHTRRNDERFADHMRCIDDRFAQCFAERFAEHTQRFAACLEERVAESEAQCMRRIEEQEKRFFQLQTHVVERLEEVARAQTSLLVARLAEHERRLVALEDRAATRKRTGTASEAVPPLSALSILREKRNSRNLNSQDSSS